MSNIIQPSFRVRTYTAPTKSRETKQTGTQGSSFLDLAVRASRSTTDVLEINSTESTQQKTVLPEAEEMQLFTLLAERMRLYYNKLTSQNPPAEETPMQKAS